MSTCDRTTATVSTQPWFACSGSGSRLRRGSRPLRSDRRRARAAFSFLAKNDDSECGSSSTATSCSRTPRLTWPAGADRFKRWRRPAQCAIWPDLYPDSDLCETVARATDERRLRRQGLLPPEEESGDEAAEEPGRKSIRRSFTKKILGPILDYAGEFELLQFVHDLALWTDVGSKRCGLSGVPLRVA